MSWALTSSFRSGQERHSSINHVPVTTGIMRPHVRQPSFNTSPRQGHAADRAGMKVSVSQNAGTSDFLPSVNFDDFHTSLTADGSLIDAFPAPGGDPERFTAITTGTNQNFHSPRKEITKPSESTDLPVRFGLNGSSIRRHNSTSQTGPQAMNNGELKTSAYTPTVATRARRKSYFANPSNISDGARAPRKSVGPGVLTPALNTQQQVQDNIIPSRGRQGTDLDGAAMPIRRPNVLESGRHQKAKSFHSPRKGSDLPPTPNESPKDFDFFTSSASKSPARSNGQRTTTPSSKRLSVLPNSAHATGIAARTISPTDVRRIKRMSMMPGVPALPNTPPTPQAESLPSATVPSNPSPSFLPRKSITPSSSRTTPEPNRKSYSSGISTSSTTSYNSVPASNGSGRISQSMSTTRLPTLKMRGDSAHSVEDEIVPPVPAIPKAYESPKGEFDLSFFSSRKASLGLDASSLRSSSSHGAAAPPPGETDTPRPEAEGHGRKAGPDADGLNGRKVSAGNLNKRTLQPLRLPPLNLLPLSSPTTTKIAALSEGPNGVSNFGNVTPPPQKVSKLPPATPMTASKAIPPRLPSADESGHHSNQIRSTSSHYTTRPEALTYRPPSTTSTQAPTPVERYSTPASRAAMSPFISSSLPKTSGEYAPLRREMSHPLESTAEAKTAKPSGPRSQKSTKGSKDETSSFDTASSVDNNNNQSFGSTLRRKLSLSRKRSTSKAQTPAERGNDVPPNPPKHSDMPPPRLPASATWNGPMLPSPSPTQKMSLSRASRNFSNSSSTPSNDRHRSHTLDAETPKKLTSQDQKQSRAPVAADARRTPRSLFESVQNHNTLSLKDFLSEAKAIDPSIDRDDVAAEEEMRKLASKRKETDAAAKELDALQRRATPKERQTPAKALQLDRKKPRRRLNTFEVGEVVDYKDIYFVGNDTVAKHKGDLENEAGNFGYDDERGDYNIVNGDHLAYRYEIVDLLGKGSFGQVVRCIDHKTGGLVAVKIIRNKKRFHQQALVEVDILKKLRSWVRVLHESCRFPLTDTL